MDALIQFKDKDYVTKLKTHITFESMPSGHKDVAVFLYDQVIHICTLVCSSSMILCVPSILAHLCRSNICHQTGNAHQNLNAILIHVVLYIELPPYAFLCTVIPKLITFSHLFEVILYILLLFFWL